jgi:hypothetical protein
LTGGRKALEGSPNYVERFKDRFRYSPVRTFKTLGEPPKEERGVSIERDHLLPLLRQVVSYRLPLDPAVLCRDIALRPLSGGRSKSRVFIVEILVSDNLQPSQPAVLKISSKENALEEARRYDTYVRWALPHQVRVDLLASAYTQLQNAVMYSFAHGTEKIFILKDLFTEGNLEASTRSIGKLFDSIGSFWLSMPKSEFASTLPERYLQRYYDG